jgi:hypothetical protein
MMTAAGNAWGTAALLPLPGDDLEGMGGGEAPTAEQRAASFKASATPDAQRLAAYFSVVKPLTPPVMRVIHRAMAPESGAAALAQVFLGGLLRPVGGAESHVGVDDIEYDFYRGLRELIAGNLTRSDFVSVNLTLHEFLQQQTGTSFDFFALLEDLGGTEQLPEAALPFVQAARDFARRFGGRGGRTRLQAPVESGLMGSLATPLVQGAGSTLSPPGNLTDFKNADSAIGWNALLSSFFDSAIAAQQVKLKGLSSQYFNPSKGSPTSPVVELPIKWPAFPRLLENSNLPLTEQLRQAELISGTFLGRMRHQDEYLEWFVTRDARTKKITRIDFTCEGPEYWDFLASTEPQVLLALYQKHVSRDVKMTDLVTNGQYNPLNVWNTRRGAMHLIQPSNSLNAEVRIAGDATILRKNADGSLKTEAQDLIDCARYGVAGRAGDPHIGSLINGLARDGFMISLRDPVGLYMSRPRLLGCATPDGNTVTQDWFKITRGSEDFILHGVFEAPAGSAFVVGDIAIGGVQLAFGGQIAKLIDMGLTGIAFGKWSIKNPAFACETGEGGPHRLDRSDTIA